MLKELRQVVQKVNAASDLGLAMDALVRSVREVMGTHVCSVYLINTEKTHYVLMATVGLRSGAKGAVRLGLNEGLVGLVGAREEPINLDLAKSHPQYRYFPETGEEEFSAFLGAPIVHHGEVLGVLVVQQKDSRRFREDEEAFLVTLSAQLAGVIAHAEATGALRQMATKARGKSKLQNTSFQGISAAPGVAIGVAKIMTPVADLAGIPFLKTENVEEEVGRFHNALIKVRADMQRLSQQLESRLNTEEQALFDVYLRMLADNALGGEIVSRIISDNLQARTALSQVVMEHVRTFEAMDDPYLRERAVDVKDLGLRVIAALDEADAEHHLFPENTILIGEELTATLLGEVPEEKLAGIVSVRGSSTSHMAILARAMGIPTVLGVMDLPYQQLDHLEVILDGYSGKLITNPSRTLKKQYQRIVEDEEKLTRQYDSLSDQDCETSDNHRVALWVNTGLMTDVVRAIERGAEGVGLYRTEVPFLLRDRFPSEEEQRQIYREQLEAFAPRPVTMRTLDIGGDKALPYFPIEEENPFLGWRGIRICLDHPEIFLVQMRGMLKANAGLNNLRILLPMITSVTELENALRLVHRAYRELIEEGFDIKLPDIGVMIEVPATMYQIRELARRVDFLSIGSNDLTQYLLAVDRNNPRVAGLFHAFHPSVLRALNWTAGECHKEGKQISICGEMAGDPSSAALLMAMGYDMLSMNAYSLPRVKSLIRQLTLQEIQQLLKDVLKMEETVEIIDHVKTTLQKKGISTNLLHS